MNKICFMMSMPDKLKALLKKSHGWMCRLPHLFDKFNLLAFHQLSPKRSLPYMGCIRKDDFVVQRIPPDKLDNAA